MASDVRKSGATPTRRWRVGVWPDPPPAPPLLGFPGPVGLWDKGALIQLDQAEHEGIAGDPRYYLPLKGKGRELLDVNQKRLDRWHREEKLPRGERHLDLAAVNLSDIDRILDFASTFGVLDVRALDAPRGGREWWGLARQRSTPLRIFRHYPGFGDDSRGASIDSTLREEVYVQAEGERSRAPTWVIAETISEFRWGARMINDLRLAWEALQSGSDPCEVDWANPRLRVETDPAHAQWTIANFLEGTLRDVLEGFSPRAWLVDRGTGDARLRGLSGSAPEDPTLLEALACELVRHMAEDEVAKRCENPSCAQLFVRQEGSSRYGQFRTAGVRYCSRRCAKAVASRRHRKRQRAARAKRR